jgi:hypothetical protein
VYLLGASATGNLVQGNLIGTDSEGEEVLGNSGSGVYVSNAASNTIGGTLPGSGNLISGNNHYGVALVGPDATSNLVQGNLIGTQFDGLAGLGNGLSGVLINAAPGNTIGGTVSGVGNTIAFNAFGGVRVLNQSLNNAIQGNSLFLNARLGIDLGGDGPTINDSDDPDSGPNQLQNYPFWIGPATINGSDLSLSYQVDSLPGKSAYDLTIEFFKSDGFGEGQIYLGSDTYSESDHIIGTKAIVLASVSGLVSAGDRVVATTTDANGNTSEFSAEIAVVPALASSVLVFDANRDGRVTEVDALQIINLINDESVVSGENVSVNNKLFYDVNRDGYVTSLDALLVINELNRLTAERLSSSQHSQASVLDENELHDDAISDLYALTEKVESSALEVYDAPSILDLRFDEATAKEAMETSVLDDVWNQFAELTNELESGVW